MHEPDINSMNSIEISFKVTKDGIIDFVQFSKKKKCFRA